MINVAIHFVNGDSLIAKAFDEDKLAEFVAGESTPGTVVFLSTRSKPLEVNRDQVLYVVGR